MAKQRSIVDIFDVSPALKAARFRYGRLQTRGVPAILLGVAAIIVAAGVSSALQKGASLLPETLREARDFWRVVRASRAELSS
jgi:hypothetical protein